MDREIREFREFRGVYAYSPVIEIIPHSGLMDVCMSQIPRGYIVEELCRQCCRTGIGLESCGYPDRGNISVTGGKRAKRVPPPD